MVHFSFQEIAKFADQMYDISLAEDVINMSFTFNLGDGPYLGPYFEDIEFKRREDEKAEKVRRGVRAATCQMSFISTHSTSHGNTSDMHFYIYSLSPNF